MVEATEPAPSTQAAAPEGSHRWIVGVDGSECSRHAALWAAKQAPGRATELQLTSTWNIPVSTGMTPMAAMTTSASFEALERSAMANVDDIAQRIGPALDIPVTQSVGRGGAAALLLEAARHSSLLVVGSRGRGGFARLLLGSTSTQCATHSTSPVAVVPSTAEIGRVASMAVAFDGSANSIAALVWAIEFADPGSTINCVSVWDTAPVVVGTDQFVFPAASDLASERLAHLFKQSIARVERSDIDVQHLFVEAPVRATLAAHASTADLVVMGARGHGAIGSALLGSVSSWLLHNVERPMVVVPHHDPADSDDD